MFAIGTRYQGKLLITFRYACSSGKLARDYLKEETVYSGVKLASMERCQTLRFMSPDAKADTCAVSFYTDGTSIMGAIAAENFEHKGKQIAAGQPVEFLEDGQIFLE